MAMIDMDKSHHGSILTWSDWFELKLGLIFSSFNAVHARKSPKKIILVSTPWWSLFDVFLQEHFV